MSLTAARMAALRLGYIPDLTSSSSPVKYASGRRTVTSFIHVSPDTLHVTYQICSYSLNRVYLDKIRINKSFASLFPFSEQQQFLVSTDLFNPNVKAVAERFNLKEEFDIKDSSLFLLTASFILFWA